MKTTFWWPFACQLCSVYAGHLGKEQMELHLSQGCTAGRGCFLSTLVWWNWQHILWPIWAMKKGGPCCWWYRGLFHTMGVIINHYNDPIKQPVYRKSIRVFFCVAHLVVCWMVLIGSIFTCSFFGEWSHFNLTSYWSARWYFSHEIREGWMEAYSWNWIISGSLQYEFIWSCSGCTPKVEQLAPEKWWLEVGRWSFRFLLGPDGQLSGASFVSFREYSYL